MKELDIGKVARWSGLPASTLRYYEEKGLIHSIGRNGLKRVFAESVLIFVEDKAQAIRECVRVARPGGYVGLNEGFWTEQPPAELIALARDAVGPCVPTLAAWQALSARAVRMGRVEPVGSDR